MNEKQAKAIERCNELIKESHSCWIGISNQKAIETVLESLEKKNKVIDLMAEWINKQDIDEEICKNNITHPELCNEHGTNCIKCIKEYFERKVTDINVGEER